LYAPVFGMVIGDELSCPLTRLAAGVLCYWRFLAKDFQLCQALGDLARVWQALDARTRARTIAESSNFGGDARPCATAAARATATTNGAREQSLPLLVAVSVEVEHTTGSTPGNVKAALSASLASGNVRFRPLPPQLYL
jgi:hypothetical protein